jgi:hypothetical protein
MKEKKRFQKQTLNREDTEKTERFMNVVQPDKIEENFFFEIIREWFKMQFFRASITGQPDIIG